MIFMHTFLQQTIGDIAICMANGSFKEIESQIWREITHKQQMDEIPMKYS